MAKRKKARSESSPIAEEIENGNELDQGEEKEEESGFDFIEAEDLPRNIDSALKDFLNRNKLLDREYKVSLYKYAHPNQGLKKELQYQYFDECPTEHDIGLTFGSGRYIIILGVHDKVGKWRTASSKFNIAVHYDKMKEEKDKGALPHFPTPVFQGQGGGGNMNAGLGMVKEVIGMLLPLIAYNQKQANTDPFEMMGDSYKSMSKVLTQSLLDNTQMINDAVRKNLDLSETYEDGEETTGLMGVVNTLSPILEKLVPYIIGGDQKATKSGIDAIKNNPLYKVVIQDKKALKKLYKFIKEKHGAKVLGEVVSKLNIKEPK